MRKANIIGGIFLVCGTSIGTGILGIPTSTAQAGFVYSTGAFVVCWVFTTIAALYLLEANLWLKNNTSLSGMSEQLLGIPGKILTWILNLSLLYALICLYLLAAFSWFSFFVEQTVSVSINQFEGMAVVLGAFSVILFLGMRIADKVNRWLTVAFLVAFAVIIAKTFHHVNPEQLGPREFVKVLPAIPLLITAFGYSVILPVMSSYFNYHPKKLVKMILIGSFIALVAYVFWELVTLGNIPLEGANGLLDLAKEHDDGTGVIRGLNNIAVGSIAPFVNVFTFGIITTSFLGVSLALYHFIKEGFHLTEKLAHKSLNLLIIYMPPVLLLSFYPAGFHQILSWAGVIVSIYLGIIPVLMVWNGRYRLKKQGFKVPGGKGALAITFLFYSYIVLQKVLAF